MDNDLDGVPLPGDASPLANTASKFAGTWVGTWDGVVKTVLVVEAVSDTQEAKVIYAVGDNPGRFKRVWSRTSGKIDGNALTIELKNANVRFELSGTGRLRGIYANGSGFAVLARRDLSDLLNMDTSVPWSIGTSQLLLTDLEEDGKPVRLETVVFDPEGEGPFPLAVISHGSTGAGTDKVARTMTWSHAWLADVLNERRWRVAFPQRRGRGKSDGLYDEGFEDDRSKGYTCDPARSLAGAERAMADLHAAIAALRNQKTSSNTPVLLAGQSRGGALSMAYASRYSEETAGVVNFVGGWIGEGCATATKINQALLAKTPAFPGSTLWIYGRDDVYYSVDHSRENFTAFELSGGAGKFIVVTVAGDNNGHYAMAIPPLWGKHVSAYLDEIEGAVK
ncbi:MAG: dienelactone hydrolase family protein [Hyphomicrobiaceae bacterium]